MGTKTPRCALLKALKKKKKKKKKCFTERTLLSIQFGLKYMSTVRISKDEAPTPLPVVGPLFISPLSFHLSRALLGAWRFVFFRCVYSSFHNRLDLIKEPAFYWVFYFIFPVYPQFIRICFIIRKDEKVLFVLVQYTSDLVAFLG